MILNTKLVKTHLKTFLIFILVANFSFSQKKEDYKTYTVESAFTSLKKQYQSITPIKPLDSKTITFKENITYKKTENSNLKLDAYLPKEKGKKTYPTVLLIHGGGWLTGSKENQRIMAQHLALKGYVAITASYRLGFEAVYPAGVIDLKDAVRWMRKHSKKYHINPNKIAVLGASAGAQLAGLLAVTPNSSLYKPNPKISDAVQAYINVDGIVSFIHPEAAAESKPGKTSMAGIWLGGEKEENFKKWKEASPLEYVGKNTPPTLFINSAQPRFHAGRDDMITILNEHNIYSEVRTIPDSPHSFWMANPWFETTLNYTINFLNKVFKDETSLLKYD